jgi:hypothetical protein
LSLKTSLRKSIGTRVRVHLPACCPDETHCDATWRERVVKSLGHVVFQVFVLVYRSSTTLLDLQPVELHLSCVRYTPKHRGPRSGISPHMPESSSQLLHMHRGRPVNSPSIGCRMKSIGGLKQTQALRGLGVRQHEQSMYKRTGFKISDCGILYLSTKRNVDT